MKFWTGTREQSQIFDGNTGTQTPPGGPSDIDPVEAEQDSESTPAACIFR